MERGELEHLLREFLCEGHGCLLTASSKHPGLGQGGCENRPGRTDSQRRLEGH